MKTILLSFILLAVAACSPKVEEAPKVLRQWDMGPITKALVAPPTSHYVNDLPRMQIRTDKIVITVIGIAEKEVPIGGTLTIVDMNNHQRYALLTKEGKTVKGYIGQWWDYEKDPYKDDENREAH